MPSSRGSSRPRNRALVSRIASRFLKSEPPGKPNNTEVGSLSLQRGRWHPTPVLLPGEPHGRRSLVGCSPWCREESGTTDGLRFHFSLSCIGEGHGNPLQCSRLESPRDGGAWWASISGVAQSQTRQKRLSSSSSSSYGNSINVPRLKKKKRTTV